jgi:hypothetical protein
MRRQAPARVIPTVYSRWPSAVARHDRTIGLKRGMLERNARCLGFWGCLMVACGGGTEAEPERSPLDAPPDVAGPPADAEFTASGLASKRLLAGTGERFPTAADRVSVDYIGWTTDGALFDSSIPRGRPSEFALNRVIAGWTEGLQLMVEGEQRRFWIPEELAYRGLRAPFGMLVFDVDLLEIVE